MTEGIDDTTKECLKLMRTRIEGRGIHFQGDYDPSKEKQLIPACCDLREFLFILRSSDEYNRAVESRFQRAREKAEETKGLFLDESKLTREEVASVYEQEESFKQLFWNFYEDVLHLSYDPNHYSSEFNRFFERYRVVAKLSVKAAQSGDREEIIERDRIRSEGHNNAARQLVKDEVVETEYLARIPVRAFLVDIGEDYIASARLSDRIRILRALPTREARVRYYSEVGKAEEAEKFSPQSALRMQKKFLQAHPKAVYVDRAVYLTTTGSISSQGDQENVRFP